MATREISDLEVKATLLLPRSPPQGQQPIRNLTHRQFRNCSNPSLGHLANSLLETDGLDIVLVGRGFQKTPGLVWTFADELGVEISMANQIRWGFSHRGGGPFLRKRTGKI
ncbi:hypothetical protein P175DRAFT_0527866 [Aspergillus ochraceoroseus IBT 24754]|uniref:Uncharacterized protein n=1 Tax=Aspergillus ochraceoroseus IBT 24754 TaxID=1392256 RepID=A0A2T5M7B6_9EURO|nr:uncharacterized protein P175DRAFT_0527866 [Aspergillus ochraceoroseus IBT 24754]PTU24396.1 hypothetical protein P175DRAFT_0527866 [Aspergillus ochraceoroseus IBT 24754]